MTITIHKSNQGELVVLSPEGRLGFGEAPEAQKAIENAIEQRPPGLIIDCSKLEYLSSAGLRVFLIAAKAAEQNGVGLAACAVKDNVESVMKLSGFERVLDIHDSLQAAVDALQ